jgi:hypothetical protein
MEYFEISGEDSMQLVRLIYSSQLKPTTQPDELAHIHREALSNNPTKGITGTLVFGDDQFIQYIEGRRSEVNELFRLIGSDPRHEKITLIDFSEIPQREFLDWHMKLVLLSETNPKVLRFSESGAFEPSRMNAETAVNFLRQFR